VELPVSKKTNWGALFATVLPALSVAVSTSVLLASRVCVECVSLSHSMEPPTPSSLVIALSSQVAVMVALILPVLAIAAVVRLRNRGGDRGGGAFALGLPLCVIALGLALFALAFQAEIVGSGILR
jgi:hypothetical protein